MATLYASQLIFSPPRASQDQGHRSSGAIEAFQLEVETAGLAKAAEDLTLLTRSLKEAWLFGRLDTLGTSEFEGQIEKHACEAALLLQSGQLLTAPTGGNRQ